MTFSDKNYTYTFDNQQEFRTIYNEIFHELIYDVDINNPKLIVDIGAHIGISVLYFRQKYPEAKIIAYEPNANSFQLLRQNIESNGIQNVQMYNKAVTNKGGLVDFYTETQKSWSSNAGILDKGWNNAVQLHKTSADSVPFAQLLEMKPAIVKLDVEGIEQGLIKNNLVLLKSVKCLLVEFHESERQGIKKFRKMLSNSFKTRSETLDQKDNGLILFRATN